MYRKATVKDPKAYKAYYNLGNYYVSRGQFEMAADYYKKAVKIKQDNPYIYYNLATTYIKLNNLSQAKNNLIKAIMYKSNVPEFHYNLAYVYKKLGKDSLAQTYLDNYNKLIAQ
jgi:Tfp pilus assembly protein PilF